MIFILFTSIIWGIILDPKPIPADAILTIIIMSFLAIILAVSAGHATGYYTGY